METAGYATLSRQSGLMREMQVVANNIANSATTGYRQEGLIFSEYIQSGEGQSSVSMARANIRNTSHEQGALDQTGGTFDFAIEGDGFFLIETPEGERLTRAGSFTPNGEGDLVTFDGHRVLDAGGAPIFIPPNSGSIGVGPDGTISANGQFVGQVAIVQPNDTTNLIRENGVMFRADDGFEPAEMARVLQGFVEASNVDRFPNLRA